MSLLSRAEIKALTPEARAARKRELDAASAMARKLEKAQARARDKAAKEAFALAEQERKRQKREALEAEKAKLEAKVAEPAAPPTLVLSAAAPSVQTASPAENKDVHEVTEGIRKCPAISRCFFESLLPSVCIIPTYKKPLFRVVGLMPEISTPALEGSLRSHENRTCRQMAREIFVWSLREHARVKASCKWSPKFNEVFLNHTLPQNVAKPHQLIAVHCLVLIHGQPYFLMRWKSDTLIYDSFHHSAEIIKANLIGLWHMVFQTDRKETEREKIIPDWRTVDFDKFDARDKSFVDEDCDPDLCLAMETTTTEAEVDAFWAERCPPILVEASQA